jgi:hypothetical protein
MPCKRIWKWALLLTALAPLGCQHWCEQHYPCHPVTSCAPAPCCCPQPCQPAACCPAGYTPQQQGSWSPPVQTQQVPQTRMPVAACSCN